MIRDTIYMACIVALAAGLTLFAWGFRGWQWF